MELERPHILDRLTDPALRLGSLTAGRGYGKSTLLAQLALRPRHVLVRLDDSDKTPVSIARLINDVLTERLGTHPSSRLDYDLLKPDLGIAGAATAVRNDLALRAPLTLLIDSAEELDSEGRRFFLDYLLSRAFPPNVRVIIAMNDDANLPLRSIIPRFQPFTALTEQDLTLTSEEMAAAGFTLEQQTRAHGWPAAIFCAQNGMDPTDYIELILGTYPEALVTSLRRASLMNTWTLGDPLHAALNLTDGWLQQARERGLPGTRVDRTSFIPHPIVQDVLQRELRARPSEYQQVQSALAGGLRDRSPIGAADAYLDAGNVTAARDVILNELPHLTEREQLSSIHPLLQRLALQPGDPLYLPFAQATFETGQLGAGLEYAERAIAAPGMCTPRNLITVAGLYQRIGRTDRTEALLVHALEHANPREATEARTYLALAYCRAALEGRAGAARAAQREARTALELLEEGAIGTEHLVIRVVWAVTDGLMGRRASGLAQAKQALEFLHAVESSSVVYVCAALLCIHFAQDGAQDDMLDAARVLDAVPESAPGEIVSLTLFARAFMAFASGAARTAAHHAARALSAAERVNAEALIKQSAVLLALTAVLPLGTYTTTELSAARRAVRSAADVQRIVQIIEDTFVRRLNILVTRGDASTPLVVRAAVAISAWGVRPDDTWHTELMDVRDRLGHRTMSCIANALQVDLPADVTEPLQVRVQACRSVPVVLINGQILESTAVCNRTGTSRVVRVTERLLAVILALAVRRRVEPDQVVELFGTVKRKALQDNLSQVRSLLRALHPLADVRSYGGLDASAWQWTLDVQQLEWCPARQLVEIYQAPVFAESGNAYPVVVALRNEARACVARRLAEWAMTDEAAARDAWAVLSKRDPALPALAVPVTGI